MFLILPENARATPAKTRHGGKIQAFYDSMSIFSMNAPMLPGALANFSPCIYNGDRRDCITVP
jgi:hypothetical protein